MRGADAPAHRRTAPGRGLALPAALLVVAVLALPAGAARAEDTARPPVNAVPVETLAQLSKALYACWAPPPGTAGSEITLRFGLTAKGEVRGKPLATYSVLTGDAETQRAFVAAAILALSRCTPIRMSEQLGRVVASRVLTLRFASGEART
ncbi:hypothetical protein [Roseixanthobacter glucoisosaccharinicivorans]|uniref:hypothetical protein n=1 Tax=Roseixanthobacter glucoisosaccharinicivorans TaxID=3119923 RepID=UPI003729B2DA